MGNLADVDLTGRTSGVLQLGVAFQTKVGVVLNQHFGIEGPVWVVTGRASLPHGFVFIDEGTNLIPVAL